MKVVKIKRSMVNYCGGTLYDSEIQAELTIIETVGILLRDTKDCVVIAQDGIEELKQYSNITNIPKTNIIDMTELK